MVRGYAASYDKPSLLNPNVRRTVMSSFGAFDLWLEWETGEPLDQPANRPQRNFGNIAITFSDGRRYALNVWTFDFLPLSRFPWPYEPQPDAQPARYVLPPDLFVQSLDRATIEAVVKDLLEAGDLDDRWLCGEDA
jgi:hypothetical protein